jgi:hypothetical protein
MSCNNVFCTCCERAYLEGLQDGYGLGYKRGFKAGYITGYTEGSLGLDPPAEYTSEIAMRLARYTPPVLPAPMTFLPQLPRRQKTCGCLFSCNCLGE